MSEASPAPALGYSIAANLGDNRQITVQCFVDSESPLAEQNAAIDKAMAVVDRQRAKYELKELRAEREKLAVTLQRTEDDFARVESTFIANKTANATTVELHRKEIEEITEAAHGRGRGGPVGASFQRRRTLEQEIKQISEEQAKAEAERSQHLDQILISIDRYKEGIAEADRKIADAEALIGDG